MSFRPWVLVTHRWLGLGSSLILAIVGVTGAFLVAPGLPLNKYAGALHERLALGAVGRWVVVAATLFAVLLELGGIYLWWKRKLLRVRMASGWRQGLVDLHHVAGAVGLPLMFLLAFSGVGMAFFTPRQHPKLRGVTFALHTSRSFPTPIKLLYVIGTTGFAIQGLTGVVMWWRPNASGKRAEMKLTEIDRHGR